MTHGRERGMGAGAHSAFAVPVDHDSVIDVGVS